MNLWQKNCLAALVLSVSVGLAGGVEASIISREREDIKYIQVKDAVPVKILADYRKQGFSGVLDLGTYTKVDDKSNLAYINERMDGNFNVTDMGSMQCSCCIKPVTIKGEKVVLYGRNMDLPVTHCPAYVFRIAEPGKYKTVNIGYLNNLQETFDQIAETRSMEKGIYDRIPYNVTDAMNEKGLVIEANIRSAWRPLNCQGTNPGKMRISSANVTRYFADHCGTIEEVLAATKNLDIYTPNSNCMTWHVGLAMMDATGRYGVMEFANNKVIWHEGHPGQTNFWIDKRARKVSGNDCGNGRWASLMAGYNNIKTMDDMLRNMEKIWYTSLFRDDVEKMTYDPATDMIETDVQANIDTVLAWQKKYGIRVDKWELAKVQAIAEEQAKKKIRWDNEFIHDPSNLLAIYTVTDFVAHAHKQLPVKAKKLSGLYECSDISYVVNNKEKVYHVKFFEQPKVFHFGIDQ